MHYRKQYAFVGIQKIQHEKYLDIPVWYVQSLKIRTVNKATISYQDLKVSKL